MLTKGYSGLSDLCGLCGEIVLWLRFCPAGFSRLILVCFFVFLAAFLFEAIASGQANRPPPINYKAVRNLEEVKDHPAAPEFALPNPDGKKLSLNDFRGKVVFLNFWASWCVPCREEMPAMERLYQEFKGKGLEILAVNVKDTRKDALAFVKELKLSYPILLDPEGQVGLLYGAWGLPATYLIDEKGMVLARLWGPAEWYGPEARNLIKTILERKK
ncbi:MAG: peroxiredoxin family protein [Candidatus Binatia bacterium]